MDFSGLLLIAPIITSYDWKYNFELICDASVYDVGIVLSQRKNKKFQVTHFARKEINES